MPSPSVRGVICSGAGVILEGRYHSDGATPAAGGALEPIALPLTLPPLLLLLLQLLLLLLLLLPARFELFMTMAASSSPLSSLPLSNKGRGIGKGVANRLGAAVAAIAGGGASVGTHCRRFFDRFGTDAPGCTVLLYGPLVPLKLIIGRISSRDIWRCSMAFQSTAGPS